MKDARRTKPIRGVRAIVATALLGALLTATAPSPLAGAAGSDPVINEFVADHTGSDTNEFVEILGSASTDYSTLTLVQLEGDSNPGTIDTGITIGTTNAAGYWTTGFQSNLLENGSITLLLVEDFTGSVGQDLDTNNDGVLDVTPWTQIVDSVATSDGGGSDHVYGAVDLPPGFDGVGFQPGGASRIPNGVDTDSVSDWVRNDFHGFGLPGFSGSPDLGEAENTHNAPNSVITVISDPIGICGDSATSVHDIQGSGSASLDVGSIREIEGVVVGDFEGFSALAGFFVQEEDTDADADVNTSEGIFVFNGSGDSVSLGQTVRVRGGVTEHFGLTELTNVETILDCGTGETASSTMISLPVSDLGVWETVEGMSVTFPQTLSATGNFTQGRFGEVDLSFGVLDNPTNVVAPGSAANALQELNDRSRIQMDDGSNSQNPAPLPPYLVNGTTLRTGDTVTGVTGVISFGFGNYELHPSQAVNITRSNDRPGVPDVGGSIQVGAYNVLNYFTTLDGNGSICGPNGTSGCRGADTQAELDHQRAKLVSAISQMDADIVGLMEIENGATDFATADLVAGLNDATAPGTYDYVATAAIGDDAIKVAIIYKPGTVELVGDYAILDSSVDSNFNDDKNRPALAQTFREIGTDDVLTVAVNHLKSKGSNCNALGDPDTGDGQANCNLTRESAAIALANWMNGDPTGVGNGNFLITGDLNSYAMEDPIVAIETAGYTDLIDDYLGSGWAGGAYSFNFFSQSGYLDHGLASPDLAARVTGAGFWHVNADEASALDYNNFNQAALFSPDPYRSSDHDPVLIGVCETTAPVVEVTASPDSLWPPNHKYRDVETTISVTDADSNATVSLVSVTSNEPDNGPGDGNTVDDIVIVDDTHFELRAERAGGGDGRIYTITYEVTDACGNTTIASATVTVPKSKGKGR